MGLHFLLLFPFSVAIVLSMIAAHRNDRAPSPGIVSSTLAMVIVVGEVLRTAQGGSAYRSPGVLDFHFLGPGLETAWLEAVLLGTLGIVHLIGLCRARLSEVAVVTPLGWLIGLGAAAATAWMGWCRYQTHRIPEAAVDTEQELHHVLVWNATSWQSGAIVGCVLMFVPFLSLVVGVAMERRKHSR